MSGDAVDTDLDAAEFVLGLLSEDERARVLAVAARDGAMRDAIAGWAARLEPLALAATPVPVSGALWDRIAASVGGGEVGPAAPQPAARAPSPVLPWAMAAVALVLAALMGALLGLGGRVQVSFGPPPAPPKPPAAVMVPAPTPAAPPKPRVPPQAMPPAPAVVAAAQAPPEARGLALLAAAPGDRPWAKVMIDRSGTARLALLRPLSLPRNREMALWVWPRGEPAPVLVGAVEAGVPLRFPYALEDGTPVMVTAEARGLPVGTRPGPTLFQGDLALVE